ncbi:25629_t:CDS:2, partial [Gigaspora margarita]
MANSFRRLVIAAAICIFSLALGSSGGSFVISLLSLRNLLDQKKDKKKDKDTENFSEDIVKNSKINCPNKLDHLKSSPLLFVKALIKNIHIMMICRTIWVSLMSCSFVVLSIISIILMFNEVLKEGTKENMIQEDNNEIDHDKEMLDLVNDLMPESPKEFYQNNSTFTTKIGILIIIKLMARYMPILHGQLENKDKNTMKEYTKCMYFLLISINAYLKTVQTRNKYNDEAIKKALRIMKLLEYDPESEFNIFNLINPINSSNSEDSKFFKNSIENYLKTKSTKQVNNGNNVESKWENIKGIINNILKPTESSDIDDASQHLLANEDSKEVMNEVKEDDVKEMTKILGISDDKKKNVEIDIKKRAKILFKIISAFKKDKNEINLEDILSILSIIMNEDESDDNNRMREILAILLKIKIINDAKSEEKINLEMVLLKIVNQDDKLLKQYRESKNEKNIDLSKFNVENLRTQ